MGELIRQVPVWRLSLPGNTDKVSGTLCCHTDVDHTLLPWFRNLPDPKNHLEKSHALNTRTSREGPRNRHTFPVRAR